MNTSTVQERIDIQERPETQERHDPTSLLSLNEARVDGPRGRVFGPITAASDRPVTVITGASGSGRTSLLLAISGRMRTDGGEIATLGETRVGAIRNMTGIAGFAGIDELEPAVTLAATLRERLSWELPWWRRTPRMTGALATELLAPGLGTATADPSLLCRELSPADDLLVRVALALMPDPALLVVDDLDALREPSDRARVAARLREISRRTPVVIATSDPRDAALFDDPARITL